MANEYKLYLIVGTGDDEYAILQDRFTVPEVAEWEYYLELPRDALGFINALNNWIEETAITPDYIQNLEYFNITHKDA